MDTRLDHPELLSVFAASSSRHVRRWAILCIGVWLLLIAGDWMARFRLFHWQNEWWPRAAEEPASGDSADQSSVVQIPEQVGAGLTHMVPVPGIASQYAETHLAYEQVRDSRGYFNGPAPVDGKYPIVMVGDSFMISLGTQHVAQVLSERSGMPVYNHGMFGAGPFKELENFILQDRFDPKPSVVIWNLSARELGAPLFVRQPVEAWFQKIDVWKDLHASQHREGLRWDQLSPAHLRKAWPDTSLLAYAARHFWAQVKLEVFRSWPPDVLGAEDPQYGPMLFYRENIRLLSLYDAAVDAPAIVKTVLQVARGLQAQGIQLIVMLVPEKEQIHCGALPEADQKALAGGPALLAAIQQGLEDEDIPVVNLMPTFRQATESGTRLYWRDDTHWNDAGIRLAAEELWQVVEPLLP